MECMWEPSDPDGNVGAGTADEPWALVNYTNDQ
jgi:hypothetical protein